MNTSATPRTALSVNINKVALLRNTRHLGIPSVTRAAEICLQAGAQGITIHPRPDERHIRGQDVLELAALAKRVATTSQSPAAVFRRPTCTAWAGSCSWPAWRSACSSRWAASCVSGSA